MIRANNKVSMFSNVTPVSSLYSVLVDQGLSLTADPVVSVAEQLDVSCFLPLGSSASPSAAALMGSLQQEWPTLGGLSSREENTTVSDVMVPSGGQVSESMTGGGSMSSTATTSPAMSASMDTDEASRDMMNANFMDAVSPCTTSATSSSMGHMNLQVGNNIFYWQLLSIYLR